MIDGKPVDLIRFESRGGDSFSKSISVPLAVGVIPLGPIPVVVSFSFKTELSAGWQYYVGLGVDTVGFYIDPRTSISGFWQRYSRAFWCSVHTWISGVDITAGVGGAVTLSAGFYDPDPRDGRIYLDELVQENGFTGDSLLNAMSLSINGEAFDLPRSR
ncbi:MAG: hypothetical protein R3C56_13010 [Pirellulaceae bacterium]